ncbi:MAG: hypothetical protein ACHRHE_13855, partial [Tepidisphaerales bacterium]
FIADRVLGEIATGTCDGAGQDRRDDDSHPRAQSQSVDGEPDCRAHPLDYIELADVLIDAKKDEESIEML